MREPVKQRVSPVPSRPSISARPDPSTILAGRRGLLGLLGLTLLAGCGRKGNPVPPPEPKAPPTPAQAPAPGAPAPGAGS